MATHPSIPMHTHYSAHVQNDAKIEVRELTASADGDTFWKIDIAQDGNTISISLYGKAAAQFGAALPDDFPIAPAPDAITRAFTDD